MKNVLLILIACYCIACSPKVTTTIQETFPVLDYRQDVTVLDVKDIPPSSAIKVGMVKVADNGFTMNCKWDEVMDRAKEECRKAGGNVLKLVSHLPPDMMSDCHRITAIIYRADTLENLKRVTEPVPSSVDTTWNYAKLYVYRPSGSGSLVSFNLYLDDSLICRVKYNSVQEIKLTRKGINKLWAKTEATSELPVDIEFGKEYYLRCYLDMGVGLGKPELKLVDETMGKYESQLILKK